MPTSFQPEKPYEPAKHSNGRSLYIVLAVVSSLLTMMLAALALPQWTGENETNWLLTIGLGLIVFVGVLAYGWARRRGKKGTAQ